MPIAVAGVLRLLTVKLFFAPSAGSSWTWTLYKNGVATDLVVTIADTATEGQDTTHSVSVSPGDYIALESNPINSPDNPFPPRYSLLFETSSNQFSYGGHTNLVNLGTSTSRQYMALTGGQPSTSSDLSTRTPCPIHCTIRALYVRTNVSPGSGNSITVSIYKNGSEEASSQVVLSDAETTEFVTGLAIDVQPGDELSISQVSASSPTASLLKWAVAIEPDTSGEAFIGFGHISSGSPSATVASFQAVSTNANNPWRTANEEYMRIPIPAETTFSKLRLKSTFAPGSGKSFTIRSRVGASASPSNGSLAAVLADTNMTVEDAVNSDVLSSAGIGYLSLHSTPSGTPTTMGVHAAAMAYVVTAEALSIAPKAMYYARRRR